MEQLEYRFKRTHKYTYGGILDQHMIHIEHNILLKLFNEPLMILVIDTQAMRTDRTIQMLTIKVTIKQRIIMITRQYPSPFYDTYVDLFNSESKLCFWTVVNCPKITESFCI